MLDDLVAFWFDPAGGRERWFGADPAFDAALRPFEPALLAAASGGLDARRRDPRGAVGLCLALDQLPRNLYRGTARAFAYDALAREVATAAAAAGLDAPLPPERRLFLYLPFEHSEDGADQDRSVDLMATLGDASWLDYAERHRDVVRRFGRFPHRNAILGRRSTPEEAAFLRGPGSPF